MSDKRFHVSSLLFMVLGAIIFLSDLSSLSYVRAVINLVNTAISPVLELKEDMAARVRNDIYTYFYLVDVEKENLELRRRLNKLLLAEKDLNTCLAELEDLERKLRYKTNLKRLRYAVSRVLYYDPSGFDLFVIIEGGKDRGFKEGDLVVSEGYVVGFIESVFGSTSRVVTPYNEKFSSSAVLGASKKKYIYKGGFPEGALLHVKVEEEVESGEEVFFTSTKRRLPPFLIGRVSAVSRGKDPFFKEVRVKPAVDPRSEGYLFVIRRVR